MHVRLPTRSDSSIPSALGNVSASGRASEGSKSSKESANEMKELMDKKAFEVAKSPVKNILMTAFMMYMVGNNLSIFPIIVTFMTIVNAFKGAAGVTEAFTAFPDAPILYKVIYVGGHILFLGVALIKCHFLGLMPTPVDFIHIPDVASTVEVAASGVASSL